MGLILAVLIVMAVGGVLIWLLCQAQNEDRSYGSRNDDWGHGNF